MDRKRFSYRERYPSLLLLVVLIAAVEYFVRMGRVPSYILPAPSGVALALWRGLQTEFMANEGYYIHTFYTATEALAGFLTGAFLGIILAAFISQIRILERFLLPYIIALQAMPKVALAPILIIYLGTGLSSKLVLATILTFFPVLVNSMTGLKSVEEARILLLKSLGANRRQLFWKVKFPSALPAIFAGLRIAAARSFIAAIVAEFVGAEKGLGVLILQMSLIMDTAGIFSVLIILAMLGILLWSGVEILERKVIFWRLPEKTGEFPIVQRGPTAR